MMLSVHCRPPKDKGKFFGFQLGLDVANARLLSSTFGYLHKEVTGQVSRPWSNFDQPLSAVKPFLRLHSIHEQGDLVEDFG